MSPFEVVQAMQSAGVGVVGLDLRRTVVAVRWRSGCWRNGGDTFSVRFPANRKIRRVPRGESETPPPPPETFFRTGRKPVKLRTDKGTEYRNRDVQRLLKRELGDHFFTQNEQKSSYAERAIKKIKSKLNRYMSRHQTHRWIDVLDSVMQLHRKLSSR